MVKLIYHDVPWNSNFSNSNTFFTGFPDGNQTHTIQEIHQKFLWSFDSTEIMKLDATGNLFVSDSIHASNVITTNNLNVSNISTGNIIPSSDSIYSLGTSCNRFKDLFLSGNTLYLDNTKLTNDTAGNLCIKSTLDSQYRSIICDKVYVGEGSNLIAISRNSEGTGLAIINPNDTSSNTTVYLSQDQANTEYAKSNTVSDLQSIIQGFSNTFQSSNITASNILTHNLEAVTVSFVDTIEVNVISSNVNASNIFEGDIPLSQKYLLSNSLLSTISSYHLLTDFQSYSDWVDTEYAPSNTLSNYTLLLDFQSFSNWTDTQFASSNTLSNYILNDTFMNYSNWESTHYALSNISSNYTLLDTFYSYSNWVDTQYAFKTISISPGVGLVGGGNLSSNVEFGLSNVGVPGTYGTSNKIPVITTDAYGRLSSVTESSLYIGRIGLENVVVLTSGSSYTPSVGVTRIMAYILGGGGGGGGGCASEYSAGGGGGAGGLCSAFLSNIGTGPYVYDIGLGGLGGNIGDGGDGGNSYITIEGTTFTGSGGYGGIYSSTTGTFAGGLGGTTSNSLISCHGESGTPGIGNYVFVLGGKGGSSIYGAGGNHMFYTSSGDHGKGYGAGGGGAANDMTSNSQIGGNGSQGIIIIYEHL